MKGGLQASFLHTTPPKNIKNKNAIKCLLVFLAKRKEILKQTLHQILDSTRGHHPDRKNLCLPFGETLKFAPKKFEIQENGFLSFFC